jgi:hypothetical protein
MNLHSKLDGLLNFCDCLFCKSCFFGGWLADGIMAGLCGWLVDGMVGLWLTAMDKGGVKPHTYTHTNKSPKEKAVLIKIKPTRAKRLSLLVYQHRNEL